MSFAALAALLATGCAIYLFAGGARPGAPFVFFVLAAVALSGSLYLLSRAALSVMVEPQADEVRVASGRRRKELEREKQLLLKALKELAFDHEMHKISDADYQEIAAAYRARAVRIMRQLDETTHPYRAQIAEELAARLGSPAPATAARDQAAADEEGQPAGNGREPAAASASPGAPSPTAVSPAAPVSGERRACPACGAQNEPDAVFCKKCGQRVVAEVAQ